MRELIGQTVGRFEVRRLLGTGGMGAVYAAHDPQLKRTVAIKRLPESAFDPRSRERVLNEARAAARLAHQGVAALYDVVEEDDRLYIVMEYVEGDTLEERPLPLPEQEVVALARQCARALAAAHSRGVVHGDIKPANLMVTGEGEVKLLDFGVAGIMRDALTDTRTATFPSPEPGKKGLSLSYAAPEVLRGEGADPRSDLYSLGLVLYKCVTGSHPFAAETPVASASRMLHEDAPPVREARDDVSAELAGIIDRLLAREPDDRISSATELGAELDAVVAEGTTLERPTGVERFGRPGGDPFPGAAFRRTGAAVVGLVLLALVGLGGWWLIGAGDDPVADGSGDATAVSASLDPTEWVIGVLPVEEEQTDPDLAALADGLAATLTARLTDLSGSHGLQVVPTRSLREEAVDTLDEARRLLGVTLAVNFHLRRQDDVVRVNLHLLDVRRNRQLDAVTVDGDMADLLALEEEVATSVLEILSLELGPGQWARIPRPSEPQAFDHYLRGKGYLQEYDEPENVIAAIELFRQAIEVDPDYAAAHAGLGEALWQRWTEVSDPGLVDDAEAACRRAVSLDESDAAGHVCLGTVLLGTGNPTRAATEFDLARRLDPSRDDAFIGLAQAYEELGELDLAEETYRAAIRMRPRYWGGYSRLGTFYYDHGRHEEALEAFQEVVRLAPESYRGYSNLGAAHYRMGEWREAERLWRRAIEINPDDFVAVSNLAVIEFFYLKDYAAAARRFERATELEPGSYLLHGNLADALHWSGEGERADAAYSRALEMARSVLEVNPRDSLVLADVAYYLAMLGRDRQAREHIDRAIEAGPSNVETTVVAARVHHRLGNDDLALSHLEAAVEAGYPRSEIRQDPLFQDLEGDPRYDALFRDG